MGKDKKRHRDEEDKAEREHRKAQKKAEKVAKMLGYTNDNNPFGDSNLLQPFVWGKKVTKERSEGKQPEKDSEEKRLELLRDVEKVRKRREDRERELEEMERLRSEEQRLREAAMYGDWQQKEEEFHLEQTAIRSKIRLTENRQQPIDVLAKNILLVEGHYEKEKESAGAHGGTRHGSVDAALANLDVEIRDPVGIIEGLGVQHLEQLVGDCDSYLQLEKLKKGPYEAFWAALKTIVLAELHKKRRSSDRDRSVHKTVEAEVQEMLRGKTDEELDLLQRDVEKSIRERKGGDVSYWEQMAEEVALQRARTLVEQTHTALLRKQFEILSELRAAARAARKAAGGSDKDEEEEYQEDKDRVPEDIRRMEASGASSSAKLSAESFAASERDEEMGKRDEISLPGATYWWQDKHRPRKPRYFNRVRTGWDWNKYNSTHYDFDNPPPKKIQGYKFTVFYPDLIDKTKTPKYFLEPCDDPNFVIIRFSAGPPYEDIAFKIINKEWDVHRRAGFRCVFDRGVLQLHFNFKRQFYRR